MNSRCNVAHEDALIMVLFFTFVNMNITHSCYSRTTVFTILTKILIRVEYLSLQKWVSCLTRWKIPTFLRVISV